MKFVLYYFETDFMDFDWIELGSFETFEAALAVKELDKLNGEGYLYRIKREEILYEDK